MRDIALLSSSLRLLRPGPGPGPPPGPGPGPPPGGEVLLVVLPPGGGGGEVLLVVLPPGGVEDGALGPPSTLPLLSTQGPQKSSLSPLSHIRHAISPPHAEGAIVPNFTLWQARYPTQLSSETTVDKVLGLFHGTKYSADARHRSKYKM